jgi:hypothetical protein
MREALAVFQTERPGLLAALALPARSAAACLRTASTDCTGSP